MSLKENSRLLILASVNRGERQVKEAARLLNISTRQVRRPLKALRDAEGAQGLAWQSRPQTDQRSKQRTQAPDPAAAVHRLH